jgi:hypothetical protein
MNNSTEKFDLDSAISHLENSLTGWELNPHCGMPHPPDILPFPPDPCYQLHKEGKCRFQGYGDLPPGPCFVADIPPVFRINFDPETLTYASPAVKKQLRAMIDFYPETAQQAFKGLYKVIKLFEAMNGIIKTAERRSPDKPVEE